MGRKISIVENNNVKLLIYETDREKKNEVGIQFAKHSDTPHLVEMNFEEKQGIRGTYDITECIPIMESISGYPGRDEVFGLIKKMLYVLEELRDSFVCEEDLFLNKDYIYIDKKSNVIKYILAPELREEDNSIKGVIEDILVTTSWKRIEVKSYLNVLAKAIGTPDITYNQIISVISAELEKPVQYQPVETPASEKAQMVKNNVTVEEVKLVEEDDDEGSGDTGELSAASQAAPQTAAQQPQAAAQQPQAAPQPQAAAPQPQAAAQQPQAAAQQPQAAAQRPQAAAQQPQAPQPPKAPQAAPQPPKAPQAAPQPPKVPQAAPQPPKMSQPPKPPVIQPPVYPQQMQNLPSDEYDDSDDDNHFGETTVLGMSNQPMVFPALIRIKTQEKIVINKTEFYVGKDPSRVDYCVFDNSAVSRVHAKIVCRNGEFFVIDNHSTNHVYVNGMLIDANVEVRLTHGVRVRLGDEDFEFRFQ